MALIDIFILLPIAFGAFKGYRKGLFVEIIGIVAFVAALVLGFKFLSVGVGFISDFMGIGLPGKLMPYLSFLLIFVPTVFFINKIAWTMRKALRLTFLGTLDGLGGAILGGLTWLIGISFFCWLLSIIGITFPIDWTNNAKIYPFVISFGPKIIDKISDLLPFGNKVLDELLLLSKD